MSVSLFLALPVLVAGACPSMQGWWTASYGTKWWFTDLKDCQFAIPWSSKPGTPCTLVAAPSGGSFAVHCTTGQQGVLTGDHIEWNSGSHYDRPRQTPTSIKVCSDLIFSTDGGSSGHMSKSVSKKVGSSSSSEISESQKSSISAEVSTKVSADAIFASASLEASVKSAFESSFESCYKQSSYEETTYTFEMDIDLSKPAYWYRAVTTIYTKSDAGVGTLTLESDSEFVISHAVQTPCVTTAIPSEDHIVV